MDISFLIAVKGSVSTKFDEYIDEGATVIYDIDEERARQRLRAEQEELGELELEDKEMAPKLQKRFRGLDLNRGQEGVFDIEPLVDLLRLENCSDLCVISIPKENAYADYMVIATCKSSRQVRDTLCISVFVHLGHTVLLHKEDMVKQGTLKHSVFLGLR